MTTDWYEWLETEDEQQMGKDGRADVNPEICYPLTSGLKANQIKPFVIYTWV